jgi:hypothetical protein
MKKLIFCAVLLLFVASAVSCRKEDRILKTEDITVNTMLAKPDGKLQVAIVDTFDKDYYNLTELEEFAKNEINVYNQKAGGNKVTMDDVREKNGDAIILMSYDGMEQYSNFNQVTAAYFNSGIDNISLALPDTLVNVKEKTSASTAEVIKSNGYKVLVLNEPYNVIVDGTVKYYSDNAKLLEKDKVKTAQEGTTVIVYKP